jgi:hypothetical protein
VQVDDGGASVTSGRRWPDRRSRLGLEYAQRLGYEAGDVTRFVQLELGGDGRLALQPEPQATACRL